MNEQILLLEQHIKELAQKAVIQVGEQGNLGENIKRIFIGGENLSYHMKNVTAQQQLEMLENHMYALKTQGYVFKYVEWNIYAAQGIASRIATKMESFSRRSGTLNFYHLNRKVENKKEDTQFGYLNLVPSNYIASIIALPTSGIPGINIKKRIEFGSNLVDFEEKGVTFGKLIKNHHTDISVNVPLNDLTKHMFISGVTGSGKTSTIKSLLSRVYCDENIPFLVIEPAKTEYKYLRNCIPTLKIFMLGIEGSHSLRLNPFSFPEGIHIQTHVDYLKSVFVAAFPMYGPMPYILETALYSIYRRAGWDFISGQNIYQEILKRYELFPTLEDLYLEIEDAIEQVGYSNDLSSDIQGALQVRIGSLMSGAKGSMLNTQDSHAIEEILNNPTVLELEYIGDDQEKVFLMGLLLISIYEHYVSKGVYSDSLKHLLVIEEAHRLLEKAQSNQSNESSDMKGKAIETFNNILSEIRAYGQGFVIADQIPTKLSPDIIKNTNVKIIHRLFDREDREILGDSIGLEEEEIKELIRLQQGEAVIFHGKLDSVLKMKVHVEPSILASNQKPTERKVIKTIDMTGYLIQDKEFKRKSYQLINTYLLFPELMESIEAKLLNIISKKLYQKLSSGEVKNLLGKLVNRFSKEHQFSKSFSYVDSIMLLNRIKEHEMPLKQFYQWVIEQKGAEGVSHPMERLSPIYGNYYILRKMVSINEEQLRLTIEKYGDKLSYDNPPTVDLLLRESKTSHYVDVSLLNREQKQKLCNAVIIFEFRNKLEILENFFKFKKLNSF